MKLRAESMAVDMGHSDLEIVGNDRERKSILIETVRASSLMLK